MRSSVLRLRVHAAPQSAGSTPRRAVGVPCALVLLASARFLSAQTAVQKICGKVVELAERLTVGKNGFASPP